MNSNENSSNLPLGVPVSEAQIETAAWRTFIDSIVPSGGENRVNGYYIPITDIQNIPRSYPDAVGVRTYFALRGGKGPAQAMLHLYIVPVDENGDDVLEVNGVSTIYDTTMPCPQICGTPNALNGLPDKHE